MRINKIVLSIFFVLMVLITSGCGSRKIVNNDVNAVNEKEDTYLDLYREYVYDDLFNSKEIMDIDSFNGIIIDIDGFKEPIFIAHYNEPIDGNFIKIYYIKDGIVNETKARKANKAKYLYNIKDDKLELFIYQDSSYKSYSALKDIISNKTDVRGVLEDDMNQEYVLTSDDIEYGIVDKNDYEVTFNKSDELYKNRDKTNLNNELNNIKNELVYDNVEEIVYKNYRISYGKYTYDDVFITLNKDNTYRFDYDINGDNMHIDGNCKYGYKYIYCIKGNQKFKLEVIGDNKIKYIDKTKKYNNEIFSYGG